MRQARGFTLIELLVVFAILALLMGLAPVAFNRMQDGAQYRDTVRTMLSQLRAARYRSMAEGREIRFAVDLNDRRYGIDDAEPRTLPETLNLRATVAGVEMENSGSAAIRFLPDGGATGGSIEIVRSAGGGTRLRVDWLSGRVTQESLAP